MDSAPTCFLHGRRQCCLASPQFLEYIAEYSASQPALVSPDSHSSSDSSTSTVVNSPPAEATPAQKTSGQLTPRPPSTTPTSILIKARKDMDIPRPDTQPPPLSPARSHSSPTPVSEPLRSPPTPPPPVSTSSPPTSRPMTSSAVAPPTRRRTLDFATDENSARRDSRAVNAIPKPAKPIYPRPKITKSPVKPFAPITPRNAAGSNARSRATAATDDGSKVAVKPQPKDTTSITNTPSAKSTGHVKSHSTPSMTPIAPKATPTLKLPNPTNHVHLSRKTDTIPISFFAKLFSSKSTHKKRQSEISDIKDVFVIDPGLVLPKGLFRALDDNFVGLGRKDSFDDEDVVGEEGGYQQQQHHHHHGIALKRSRSFSGIDLGSRKNDGNNATPNDTNTKKNLKLEVENGGIDVDVHLVPSLDRSSAVTKRTTIDLRLLPDENFKPGNHPLIARIHAPEKRAPFHLTARTYALSPPLANEPTSPTPPSIEKPRSSVLKQHRRAATSPATLNSISHIHHPASLSTISLSSPSYNTPLSSLSSTKLTSNSPLLDKSNMEIQIPRSYHGPITIHVASGNLDEHIWVSRDVRERSVVLREGRFARGCFVGRQGFDEDEEEGEGEDDGKEKGDGGCEVCGRNKGESDEGRKVASPPTSNTTGPTASPTTVSSSPKPSGDVSSTPITSPRIVKRKPVKSFSLKILEKNMITSSLSSIQETPSPPPSPPPPPPPTTTSSNGSSPPPIPSTTPPQHDILANRPSFLDTDPNLTSSSPHSSNDHNTGWKITKNQDLNGRARRVSELHLTVAPYRSSPLRNSMTSPLSSSTSASKGGEWVSPLIRGGLGKGGEGGEEGGKGEKIVGLDELSSLPSSSSEEEEGGEGGEEGENDEAGSGSGSGTYESAESGSGNDTEQETIQCTCHQGGEGGIGGGGEGGEGRRRRKRKEWIGDRIDIMIGKGKVKIKYDDEVGEEQGLKVGRSGRWFGW